MQGLIFPSVDIILCFALSIEHRSTSQGWRHAYHRYSHLHPAFAYACTEYTFNLLS